MELPTPPCQFGSFELLETLGHGGFATVYRAVDSTSRREVAIKILHPDAKDGYQAETEARFRRELRVLGQLTNPHTVTMYDWGEQEGLLYIVFELVRGRDLRALLEERGTLDEPAVVHIVRQVLQSLDEAHSKGLLHRDIKPDNIIVFESDGDPFNVKLLDFGIARPADTTHPSITKTGGLVGTPHYMAPEHMLQQGVSARSDIYSLGVVAMELLLGRSALHGFSWGDQLERLQTGYVFSAPQLERISPGLRRVLSRMTVVAPAERLADARSVLAMLDAAHAPRVLVETRPRRSVPWAWLGGGCLVLLSLGVLFYSSREPPRQSVVVPPHRVTPVQRTDPSLPTEPEAEPLDVGRSDPDCPAPPFIGRGELSTDYGLHKLRWPAYVPESASERLPLVVLLPRDQTSAVDFLDVSGFEELADQHGFAIIALDSGVDNVLPFVEGTFDQLCVDVSRVFLVGQGNGGRLALRHSCQEWVAGVALYAIRLKAREELCGGVPVPRLMFMMTDSPMDPADGGPGSCLGSLESKRSIDDMQRMLVSQHGCSDAIPALEREGCKTWRTCEQSTLATCRVDGGQPWPGQVARYDCDGKAADYPAAQVVWSFFDSLASDPESGDESD